MMDGQQRPEEEEEKAQEEWNTRRLSPEELKMDSDPEPLPRSQLSKHLKPTIE